SLVHAEGLMKSGHNLAPVPDVFVKAIEDADAKIAEALNDDFNTPEVMAQFFEITRLYNNLCRKPGKVKPEQQAVAETYFHWLRDMGQLLSLFNEPPADFLRELDDILLRRKDISRDEVDRLVTERTQARTANDFARADELRKQLTAMGIAVQDTPTGTQWEVDKSV